MTEVQLIAEPYGSPGYREMLAQRESLLRAPLGLKMSQQELQDDAEQLHIALRVGPDAKLGGTIKLLPPDKDKEGRIRAMTVLPDYEGRGFGRVLLTEGERRLKELGAVSARLHARVTAQGFYERCGWRAEGDQFVEHTIPHILMRKHLDTPQ